jgi:Fic family protein
MMPQDRGFRIAEKSTVLVEEASALWSSVNPSLGYELGNLVRSMNCYYSNLIEGHPTQPVDIERALSGDFADNREARNLQLEAVAHIAVQAMIDHGRAPSPVMSTEFLKWAHYEFCSRLPDELLWVTNPDTRERLPVAPGEFRKHHVRVGHHLAPAPEQIGPLLDRFVEAYADNKISRVYRCAAVAASHHRLLWVHPFLDGNGRVARLFSHALFREWHIGSHLWSVSRGLGRNVEHYKAALSSADDPRRGDYDGRGNLTDEGLTRFCDFFLDISIDQVRFMREMLRPQELMLRVQQWCEHEVAAGRLPARSWALLREAFLTGTFARGDAPALTGHKERQARTVLNALLSRGVLVSDGPRSRVRVGFPTDVVERWIPTLYPAAAVVK